MDGDEGFTTSANVPGQAISRLTKEPFERWLDELIEAPETGAVALRWYTAYKDLLSERDEAGRLRYDWRKAAYMAWSVLPKDARPIKFQRDLARMLGLSSDDAFRKWRQHDPTIDTYARRRIASFLLEWMPEVLEATVTVASDPVPSATPERRLYYQLAGVLTEASSLEVSGPDGGPMEQVVVYIPDNARERAREDPAASGTTD